MYTLPALPFNFDALEPYIDTETMKIHHGKHHQAYIDKLNTALEKYPDLQVMSLANLLQDLNQIPEDIRSAVRNNGGGHFNHSLFWTILRPATEGNIPTEELALAINRDFGGLEAFKEEFTAKALGQFGSGWVFLVINQAKKLELVAEANQDCPVSRGPVPILGLDVWEHAYYLHYQNRRAEYVANFFSLINWPAVEKNFLANQ